MVKGIELQRHPCEIKNGRVWKMPGVPSEQYNVLDFNGYSGTPPLFVRFASLDENTPEKIRDFCSQFGLIKFDRDRANSWMQQDTEDFPPEWISDNTQLNREDIIRWLASEPVESIGMDYVEYQEWAQEQYEKMLEEEEFTRENSSGLNDIRFEILQMRTILECLNAIRMESEELICLNLRKAMCLNRYGTLDNLYRYKLKLEGSVKYYALVKITEIVNQYLKTISPIVEVDAFSNKLTSGWKARDVLSAMYLMLSLDISKGNLMKHCENETCNRFFSVAIDKTDTKYCSPACARAQASRQYRRRKKKTSDSDDNN